MSSGTGQVVAVVVRSTCPSCGGDGRVPGGDRRNGELVACSHCKGMKTLEQHMPIATFAEMLEGLRK